MMMTKSQQVILLVLEAKGYPNPKELKKQFRDWAKKEKKDWRDFSNFRIWLQSNFPLLITLINSLWGIIG